MRIRIVDAFTDRPFSGNPAGVLLLDSFPEDSWLRNVAAEVNLSETAFAHPLPAGGEADWALRWFTPATEVDMCGHATLATAHVLHTTGAATGTVRFATRSGVLSATAAADGTITMDFPTSALTPVPSPTAWRRRSAPRSSPSTARPPTSATSSSSSATRPPCAPSRRTSPPS